MWKQKYHELYFNENYDFKAKMEASILKDENAPNSLFKHMKAKYAKKSLKDKYQIHLM